MEWYESESSDRPLEIDTSSSKVYNYVRKNIKKENREGMDGNTISVYVYEEAKIVKEDWGLYQDLLKQRSDIDYIAIMADIDLEGV